MSLHQSLLGAAATFVAAIGTMAANPSGVSATLVQAMPIAIKVQQRDSRSFTLIYYPRALASRPVSDRGSAVRVVASQTARLCSDGRCWRQVSGSELLEGSEGMLTLRWSGAQHMGKGRWGMTTGIWSIVTGTGIYADRTGRGDFVADNAATEYRGWLITAL